VKFKEKCRNRCRNWEKGGRKTGDGKLESGDRKTEGNIK